MSELRQREPRFENKALRDLAAEQHCTIRIPGICIEYPCVSCHSNQSRHGKGKSMKAHDCFVAWGCSACHFALDQGPHLSRAQREDYWQRGFERTLYLMWRLELIRVAGTLHA